MDEWFAVYTDMDSKRRNVTEVHATLSSYSISVGDNKRNIDAETREIFITVPLLLNFKYEQQNIVTLTSLFTL